MIVIVIVKSAVAKARVYARVTAGCGFLNLHPADTVLDAAIDSWF